ncbi:MAG: DNRLRE domain-containing protein [Acidobacteriota bacterium]
MSVQRKSAAWRPLAAALAIIACQAPVDGAAISAVADTYLAPAAPDNPQGAGTGFLVGIVTEAPALVQFDLTAFAGQTVSGTGTLRLFFATSGRGDSTGNPSYSAYRALVAWDESTTYNSFGPASGVTAGVDYDTTLLGAFPATAAVTGDALDVSIAASILQDWIDNPATNFGFFILGNGADGTAFVASSRQSGNPATAPMLLFEASTPNPDPDPDPDPNPTPGEVPEPSTALLIAGGLAAVVALRKKTLV